MIGGSWEIATLEQNADFDWGVTYYPVNAETKKQFPHVVTGQQQSPKTARTQMQQVNSWHG